MTQTPSRSSLSRRVIQVASSFKAMLFRRLFRSSIYESIRPVLSGRMGWLETLSSLIGRGSQDIHRGGVLRVSAKERAKRSAAREFRRRFVMAEQLELRALMAADLGLDPTLSQQPVAAEVGSMVPGASVASPAASATEIVFVDPGVTDPQSLMQGLRTGVEFVMLDGSQDGIAQISAYLQGKSGIQAIHLVGHGRAGEIYLGSSVLGNDTLSQYAGELAQIGGALTSDGDILVYGCETAQGEQGEQFLQQLARLTSADVAGSNDITGAASLGGDWDLEEKVGVVSAQTFPTQSLISSYQGLFPPTIDGTSSWVASPNTLVRLTGITVTRASGSSTATGTVTIAPVGTPTGVLDRGANPGGDDIVTSVNNTSAGNTLTIGTKSGGSRTPWTYIYNAGGSSFFNPGTNTNYTVPGFTPTAAGTYTLRITATDSTGSATRDVTVVVGTGPTVDLNGATAGTGSSATYAEDSAPVAIAPSATITDADSTTLVSLTIRLTNAQNGTAESLSFTSPTDSNISGTYNSANGTLVLSTPVEQANASLANYQAALRSVTYVNSSQNPTTTPNRLITVVANDGALISTAQTSTVTVTASNDAPTVTAPATFSVNEDATLNLVYAPSTPFADPDTTNLTVTLAVSDGTITGNTVAGDNITVGGTATSRTFQGSVAALNTYFATAGKITYSPGTNVNGSRSLVTTVSDNSLSATATSTINIAAINDAPVATGSASLTAILEDTANPPGATVQSLFSGNFDDSIDTVTGGSSANAFAGIAIASYTVNSAQGQWQYSADGTTGWTNLDSVAARSSATIIPTGHSLRFLPAANFAGSAPTITAHLIDNSSGAVSFQTGLNITTVGATTQYSNATVVLSHTVTAVNDAPVRLTGTMPTISVNEDSANSTAVTLGLSAFTYGPGGGSDESSQTLTYTITSIPSFVNIFKSGGVNQVTVNSTVSLSELQNLVYKTVANANGSGTLQWTVVDN
ncbi:MAG: DUF4347 domain-containing protein, partial [Planctomycetota bacterium]